MSVIIPVYNDHERLRTCLRALDRQTYPRDRYEVIVVDNGSDEAVEPVTNAFPLVRLTAERKSGSYAARNKGIATARGKILAFTDSDCVPAADWIEKGVAHLERLPKRGMVAGKVELFSEVQDQPTIYEQYDQLFYLDQQVAVDKGHYGATANLFTYRTVMEEVGIFNDALKSSGDSEWGRRMYARGYQQAYGEDVYVRHPARNSLRALYKKTVRITGGLFDAHAQTKPWTLRTFMMTLRMWKPPLKLLANILFGRMGAQLPGPTQRIQITLIVLLLHYTRRFEFLRLRLGGRSKNC